jgi:glycosyltransferase involved in cell wall biosynthesis
MRLGYLHVGDERHGIRRYGQYLAAELATRGDVTVVEQSVRLNHDCSDFASLACAAAALSGVDLVHLQVGAYSDSHLWGSNTRTAEYITHFFQRCEAPVVVTLHDVNSFQPDDRHTQCITNLRSAMAGAAGAFLCTDLEARQFQSLDLPSRRFSVIPHFVERRPLEPRPRSGTDTPTIVVLGFIFANKGHGLVVRALPLIPDVRVVFAGGPALGGDKEYNQILAVAEEFGVRSRIEVTGYLSDNEMELRVAECDLAVCSFAERKSASGSISTLLSLNIPILGSNTSLIAEYNKLSPGAIPTFHPREAPALAAEIKRVLGIPRETLLENLRPLKKILSIERIADAHLAEFREIASSPNRRCA